MRRLKQLATPFTAAYMAVRAFVSQRWSALQGRFTLVRTLARAWGYVQKRNGGQYAAAISYFSFLSIFPVLLLAISVTGFVLQSHPAARQELLDHISNNIPGDAGTALVSSVKTFIANRTSVGIVGLFGLLLTGLGWIANLRAAVEVMWGRTNVQRNWFLGRVSNLVVLVGLGIGALVSIGLTAAGTGLTDQLLRALSWDDIVGMHAAVKVLGVALALVGDVGIFFWLFVRLPGVHVDRSAGLRSAVLASVGFEVLKLVGTYTVAHTSKSLTAGPFASVI
ncbi:MAG TPA: YhjD/YihY/BrkB family envelope integrity protein, partial [Jatrophihabitans sp.]